MQERRGFEAFTMWCNRRMLRMSWMVRVTDVEVLERVSEGKLPWKDIVSRRIE